MSSNVQYELAELERLLAVGFQHSTKEKIASEFERIKKAFIHEVFAFQDERHLERYIQYHQQAIITLMDSSSSSQATSTDLLEEFRKQLEDLLTFIERHFAKYFDQDAKAPELYISRIQKDIRKALNYLFRQFSLKNVDAKLIELMLHALHRVTDTGSSNNISYRRLLYAKELQKELVAVAENSEESTINEDLRALVYYLNYNATKTIVYHAYLIGRSLKDADSVAERIERLSFLRKEINQAQCRPGVAYNHKVPSLKTLLNNYITEEIDYLGQIQQVNSIPLIANTKATTVFKIKMEVSVSQVAYLVKVFLAAALVQNSNLTELLKVCAKYIATKKSETVSYDSLRAKFYNVETSTKESVKELLKSMIRFIDSDLTS